MAIDLQSHIIGEQRFPRDANPKIRPNFPENCMKMKKIRWGPV